MNADIDRIHNYWFGEIRNDTTVENRMPLWFSGGEAVDNDIRVQFEHLVLDAEAGRLDQWQDAPRGTLCLLILLDQFPLNIYRRTARAFDFEAQSVAVCKQGLARAYDRQLAIIERMFFYLPLEHSESLEDQDRSVMLYTQLLEDAPEALKEMCEGALTFAQDHRELIVQFGRYPFRNEVLGRQNTAAEQEWLDNSPSRYGQ